MKNYIKLSAIALVALAFSSCSDSEITPGPPVGPGGSETGTLTFTVSKTAITADGSDKAEFKVMKGATDVTDKSEFYRVAEDGTEIQLKNKYFTTKRNGDYTIKAHYGKEVAPETVTITSTGEFPEKYYRQVAVFKFTGTWCSFCPDGGRRLNDLQDRVFKNRLVQVAFHGGNTDEPMLIPQTDELFKMLKCDGYPDAGIDLREHAGSSTIFAGAKAAIQTSLDEYPATCGIRIDSKASNGKLDITVGVTADIGGTYRVAAFIIENKLIYEQTDGGVKVPEFQHDHVARLMLSKSVMGDSLGTLTVDTEKTQTYSIDMDSKWNLDNIEVVAYVVDETETINNIAKCEANNGSFEYKLN